MRMIKELGKALWALVLYPFWLYMEMRREQAYYEAYEDTWEYHNNRRAKR